MQNMTQDSWKMFNKIASTYDQINRILSFGMDKNWRRKVAIHLPSKKNLRILDLATGTGDQLLSLFEHGASIQKASGIDMAKEMLLIAKEKMSSKIYKDKIDLICADAQKIPFGDNTFDATTFSFGIRNVPNPLQSLQEIYRTLKPQGKCLILEFSLPPKPIRGAYLLYLRHILPRIGNFMSKQLSAYTYLNKTIESFPSGDAFATLMKQASFHKITLHPMALGAVTLYIGTKT
jgi:demethylmenaquinone methyltransferase / 2-methoxy-6-polyprenyl-1,4-benzoquinol methylase